MYLLPKQFKANGIKEGELTVTDSALKDITRYYTREAGVRSLDRELAKISRKVIKSLLPKKKARTHVTVNSQNPDKYLGRRQYTYGIPTNANPIRPATHTPRAASAA